MLDKERYRSPDRSPVGGNQKGSSGKRQSSNHDERQHKHRQSPASLLLLVLPVLLLLALGHVMQPRKAALTLESAEIVQMTAPSVAPGDFQDLTARVVVRYHAPSLWQQWFGAPVLEFDTMRLYLVTERGEEIVPGKKGDNSFTPEGGQLYAGEVTCSLAEVPRSAKGITLQVPVTLAGQQAALVKLKVR